MELVKIKGNSYFINAPTNVGLYLFKNKNCLLIDTGINNSQGNKLDIILKENNFHPKYIINTHSHLDHCGANLYFIENYPGCEVYSSHTEKILMENIDIHSSMLFSSYPIKPLRHNKKCIPVNYILDYGINKINNEKFEVISLKGHSLEQIGIITPEKVCFLGDSIFSSEILDKYSFPFLYNIEESLITLENIKNIDADFFVISHSSKVLNKNEIVQLADRNIQNINFYLDEILELLNEPLTKEDLLESICILNQLNLNFKQYFLNSSSLSAFLCYLDDKNLLSHSIEDNKLYFYRK